MDEESKKTILVVEDDEQVLSMIIKHLEHEGYRVVSATDGLIGKKLLRTEQYDLVVTDMVIPYVSGVEIIKTLKATAPDIPVIAITGFGKEPEQAAIEKNADVVMIKPVRMSVLKEAIEALLG
jgi:two-component system cell cycle sensor histidine kinase/response regulator CckA